MSDTRKTTKPNVPNLRFPGFEGEWEKMKASDLLDFFSTNSLSWEQLEYGGVGLLNLHYGLIHNGLPTQIDINDSTLPAIKAGNEPRKFTLCKEGDIAFADASEDTNDVGKVVEFVDCAGKNVVCGLHTIHGRDKLDKTVPGFKGYVFSSKAFHDQIKRIAQGTKVFSIRAGCFDEVSIGIPDKEEQKKIAALLSLIDQRISIQTKVIEDLKKLKSAFCEKMYDESNPNTRLADIIEQQSIRNKAGEDLKVLSVSNRYGFVKQSEQFEDRTIASEDTSNYKIVALNDFAYNPARINVGSIARLKNFENGIVSPMYICFRCKGSVLPEFLEPFFSTKYFSLEMGKRLEGSVRMCLSFEGLCNIPINIPSYEEQTETAKKVNALSEKLRLEESYSILLSAQKEYILSQMFI